MHIISMTNKDVRFYRILGPYLSRRLIVKELGNSVWDEDEKVWFVAIDESKVFGFASVKINKKQSGKIESVYVFPEYRKTGIATTILLEMIGQYCFQHCESLIVTATPISVPLYRKFRFIEQSMVGQYTKMMLDHVGMEQALFMVKL